MLVLPASAASVSLCESAGLTGNRRVEMYGPDGRLVTLAITDEAPAAACQGVELPVSAAAVQWFTLTDIPPGNEPGSIGLQGYFDGDEVRVSEVIHEQPEVQNERGFLPFNVDLLPYLQARGFGV